ncbi:MAG TPA: hypothetical protein VJ742_08560 [Nitrososphaera sp.]|nr:hypothetical protein [Nitrososphaera sp.]
MAYRQLICFAGYPASDGTTCTVISHVNTAATYTVTDGDRTFTSGSLSWTAIGTDRGSGPAQACYVATAAITGLTGRFKQFTFTVTQGSATGTCYFRLKPSTGDRFCVFDSGCNRSSYANMGMYRAIANAPYPVALVVLVDDFAYVDNQTVNDSETGHSTTAAPSTSLKEYDFAVAWMYCFGMMGDTYSTDFPDALASCNWAIQQGNHEFGGFSGIDTPGTGYCTTLGNKDGPGKVVYDALFGALRPPPSSLGMSLTDTDAEPWMIDLGELRILSPDTITSVTGLTVLGANQEEDVRSAMLTNPKAFTIFSSLTSFRNPVDPVSSQTIGSRGNYAAKSQTDFILSSGINSIMSTNGLNRVGRNFIFIRHDHHGAYVVKMKAAATGGNLAEKFYMLGVANVNGEQYHSDGTSGTSESDRVTNLVEDSEYDEAVLEYMARSNYKFTDYYVYDSRGQAAHILRIDCFFDENPYRITLNLLRSSLDESSENSVWTKQFTHWFTDNFGETVGTEHTLVTGVTSTPLD